jgi:CheY-like chemotaxis protein
MSAVHTPSALLVDDDSGTREGNQIRLEGQGYSVALARSEVEALATAGRSAPNVIFIHLGAAGAGAMGLIQALRSNDSFRHIPVVVLNDKPKPRAGEKGLKAVHRDLW